MQFHDLRKLNINNVITADVCIIGSGPAGLSIAGEFANTDKSVWVIESGGHGIDAPTQKLYQYENVGAQRCLSQDLIRIRSYGGTSALWSGRVAPFREVDFAKRDWVDYSGWPVTGADLNPYLERAGEILGLGPNHYDDVLWSQFKVEKPRPGFNEENLRSEFWQFSRSRQIEGQPTRFAADFNPRPSANINILLYANVTHLNTDGDGKQMESVSVTTLEGIKATIKSSLVVICCGGVENARLLLASNKQHTMGLGNQNDMVGRFFMDHPYCELGEFSVEHSRQLLNRFSHFWLDNGSGRHVYLHGLSLGKEIQEKEQLLNCAVYLVNDEEIDSSWLTAKRLVMALKTRKINMNVAKDAGRLLFSLDRILDGFFRRYFKRRPPILKSNRITLGCNVEQLPDPNSRITLSDQLDIVGMPLARIDWKVSERERNTVKRMIEVINQELPAIGFPALNPVKWLDDEKWQDNFFDVAHHMGSTRMSIDPQQSVVDENCKVHDIGGLYIAGSSVFPTAGTANPMLMIISMALRLADHLKSLPHVQAMSGAKSSSMENSSMRTVNVGIVGCGARIEGMYLPVFDVLQMPVKVTGFTSREQKSRHRFSEATGYKAFETAQQLVQETLPDFLIVAVSPEANAAVVYQLLNHRIPLIVETPLAWSKRQGQGLVDKAQALGVDLFVMEQFPYLPLEQMKRKLLDAGVFGRVYAAYNDFASYSYHGIAQLRRYSNAKIVSVSSKDTHFPFATPPSGGQPVWQRADLNLDDGGVMYYNYSSNYVDNPLCAPKALRFYGERGSMVDDVVRALGKSDSAAHELKVNRLESAEGLLQRLSVTVPGYDELVWENRFTSKLLSDEQLAVATLLNSIFAGGDEVEPYTGLEFINDIEVMKAMEFSSFHNGAEIHCPLDERRERIRKMLSVKFWRQKLLKG